MTDRQERPIEPESSRRLGVAGWIAILVLAGFVAGAIYYAVHAWNALSDVAMPPMGWVFMILGAVATFAVGAGLMALLFYSSREGKDF
jgi:ABC-type multidrug transport system permease subunit